MSRYFTFGLSLVVFTGMLRSASAQPLPFDAKAETYQSEDGEIRAFVLRLEQPFLADQFEKSNTLRLEPLNGNADLVYPKEAKFTQKHAEFYGRLQGEGVAKLQLSYEVITEDLAGQPSLNVRTTEIEISVPTSEGGDPSIYPEWARMQNRHFAELLRYYPETSFFEYVLLQSKDRYGVDPPPLPNAQRHRTSQVETGLYHTFSGGLGLQQSLQWEVLRGNNAPGDLNVHIQQLQPPALQSLDYEQLLKQKTEEGSEPYIHSLAHAVPDDQYFIQFPTMEAANRLIDLSVEWGDSLLQMLTVTARDHHLREKYERQLCLKRDAFPELFADKVIGEVAFTGSDFFFAEGTDLSVLVRVLNPEAFEAATDAWLTEAKENYPDLQVRSVNYRGHRISARYTPDRGVSSFLLMKDDVAIISNSPVVMRKIIDTLLGERPSLKDAADYRYCMTLLPPGTEGQDAYLFLSESLLKYLVGPKFKVAQKRRLQAFNNLVMLNNASLLYRMESGRSPESLSELAQGNFYDPEKVVDPVGGAYDWDADRDTATSSVFNRIKYLTPIVELDVLQVSNQERQEYARYKSRYEALWREVFDPIAMRLSLTDRKVQVETLILPFANSSLYGQLQSMVEGSPQMMETGQFASSAVGSLQLLPGRKRVGQMMKVVPGVQEVLESDPTLTDLSWLGDRVAIHYFDDSMIFEVDPFKLKRTDQLFGIGVPEQTAISAVLAATSLPVAVVIDVEDVDKAGRLLDQLGSEIVLKGEPIAGLSTEFDAYQLPDYDGHHVYVLSYQLYAVKVRLYVSLTNNQLVAATTLDGLQKSIDAIAAQVEADPQPGHAELRINFAAMNEMETDLQLYWNEKLRQAAYRNVMPIYLLVKLYDVPIDEVNSLADSKYGVTYFCPGGGEYRFDETRDQIYSSVYGNRQGARQPLVMPEQTPFSEFYGSLESLSARLKFQDNSLIGTIVIERKLDE
ncbi:hypothetical protein AB1L42_20340 [Thalassoglobus sp. JC818]|uniref:hypothetical protein n=1 Tax=Thalassoglobus sp. JC818 TaxID=3232136 RepID=UPI00345B1D1E